MSAPRKVDDLRFVNNYERRIIKCKDGLTRYRDWSSILSEQTAARGTGLPLMLCGADQYRNNANCNKAVEIYKDLTNAGHLCIITPKPSYNPTHGGDTKVRTLIWLRELIRTEEYKRKWVWPERGKSRIWHAVTHSCAVQTMYLQDEGDLTCADIMRAVQGSMLSVQYSDIAYRVGYNIFYNDSLQAANNYNKRYWTATIMSRFATIKQSSLARSPRVADRGRADYIMSFNNSRLIPAWKKYIKNNKYGTFVHHTYANGNVIGIFTPDNRQICRDIMRKSIKFDATPGTDWAFSFEDMMNLIEYLSKESKKKR